MLVEDKYLPTIEERRDMIENRIKEYKRQMYGGVMEVQMAEANGEKRNVVTTRDMMEQIQTNIDINVKELEKLGE